MNGVGVSLAILIAAAATAHAADLPSTKPAPASPPPNCYASLWSWLNSTAADCPLSYAGFTVYATIDMGIGYESNGAAFNRAFPNGVQNIITKQSNGPKWLWTPNGINQSVIGIKMSEPIGWGWSLVGTLETGFDPYSFWLANGQRAQVENNGRALLVQSANANSSRAGQWDNSQGFIGVSNPGFGTAVWGRVNTLSLDALIAYDPMGSAYAFSPFGYSGSYAGFGNTELSRSNTAVKYRFDSGSFRVAGLVQTGGYDQGNGSSSLFQGQIGGDFANLFGGTLSLDGIVNYAQDAVNVSTFTGTCATLTKGPFASQFACSYAIPLGYNNSDVMATLSNNTGLMLLAKYKWGPLTLSGGYTWFRQANPSDTYPNGFRTIGGYNVPAQITFPQSNPLSKIFTTTWITDNAYTHNRIAPFFFVGGRYTINPQLEVAAAFYYLSQNDYNTSPCTGTGITISSSKCAGSTDFYSFLIDYRPVKRVDLYAGVEVSNVYGGLANGYQKVQDIAPTAGIRVKF